eukprot:scaffold308_cov327-Pavlova_lutheri.AAC.41
MEDGAFREEKRVRGDIERAGEGETGRENGWEERAARIEGGAETSVHSLVDAWERWDGTTTGAEAIANELDTLTRMHVESKRCSSGGEKGHEMRRRWEKREKNLAGLVLRLEEYEEGLQRSIYEADLPDDGSTFLGLESEERIKEVVSYAHRTSYSTFAPVGFDTGRCGNVGYFRPAPQAEQLVASRLHKQKDDEISKVDDPTMPVEGSMALGAPVSHPPPSVPEVEMERELPQKQLRSEESPGPLFRMDLNPDIEVLDGYESPSDTSEDSD